jgi:lipid II:glycine glycyltransferase (peptidoglycan interpeptide bridge formation enzyme)
MGSNSLGREKSAMDVLVEKAISIAIGKGICFLDFGHSNENYGKSINSGLYRFKSKFGGGGVALLEFTINL